MYNEIMPYGLRFVVVDLQKLLLAVFLFLIFNSLFLTAVSAQNNKSLLPASVIPASLRTAAAPISLKESPPSLFSPRFNLSLNSVLKGKLFVNRQAGTYAFDRQARAYVFLPFSNFFREGQGVDNRATVSFVPNFPTRDILRTTVSCGQQLIADGEGFIAQVRIAALGTNVPCKTVFELKNAGQPVETLFNLPIS